MLSIWDNILSLIHIYIGKTVYAEIKEPDGYMQGGDDTTTFGIVKPNNATILKVYYDKYIPLPEPTEVDVYKRQVSVLPRLLKADQTVDAFSLCLCKRTSLNCHRTPDGTLPHRQL